MTRDLRQSILETPDNRLQEIVEKLEIAMTAQDCIKPLESASKLFGIDQFHLCLDTVDRFPVISSVQPLSNEQTDYFIKAACALGQVGHARSFPCDILVMLGYITSPAERENWAQFFVDHGFGHAIALPVTTPHCTGMFIIANSGNALDIEQLLALQTIGSNAVTRIEQLNSDATLQPGHPNAD